MSRCETGPQEHLNPCIAGERQQFSVEDWPVEDERLDLLRAKGELPAGGGVDERTADLADDALIRCAKGRQDARADEPGAARRFT